MRVPVFFVLLFWTNIAGTVLGDGEECIDDNREFEVATQERVTFKFKVPNKFNGNPKTELDSWTIFGPDNSTKCKNKIQSDFVPEKEGNIESCKFEEASGNCIILEVTLPNLDSTQAGIWNISREYRDPTIDGKVRRTENHSINIYGTEIDRRYNGTIIQVKGGEYIVMNFSIKNHEKSACRLINRKTNETYDLNAREHRFSGKRMGIQKLDGCGFRMRVDDGSEGLWSLIGGSGWIRQRSDFQLVVNSSIHRDTKDSPYEVKKRWMEDFPAKFDIIDVHRGWLRHLESIYWELERPDGMIFFRSELSQRNINFNQITEDEGGLWRLNEGSDNSIVLIEREFSITVTHLPVVYYYWSMNSNDLTILLHPNEDHIPTACILKNQNGKKFVGEYFEDERMGQIDFLYDISGMTDEEKIGEWEFSLDYNHTTINALIVGKIRQMPTRLPYVWKSVRRIKYVVRGEEFKVKCEANRPLANCTLKDPKNATTYSLDDIDRCSRGRGFCGCVLTIRNANDTHDGTWNCEMEFEGSRKIKSLAPISVTDSYLISEIERPNYENGENNLKLNCRPLPTMHYRKIRYCKWFDSENRQILTGNSSKYKEVVRNNDCSLELKVLYRKDLNAWKCVAYLDGNSEEEIYATFDLSKMSFNVTEEEPEKNIGIRDEYPLGILPLKIQDNTSRKLTEASDISPAPLQQKISVEKLEKSPEASDISILVMVIGILISIVSFSLAVGYCVYNKMQMRKGIREAQSVRKLLVGIKHGPLDPGTMLNEQLDYIRYNEDRWEYPWKNLEFYEEIGKGHFGYVVKASAKNIKGDGKKTQVAVKRIFSTSLNYVRALVYELKILSSLTEKHPHIVNLLGACTRDVPEDSGGLCVILEYCRCGNLHDFLEKNKSEFVNQFERIIVGQIDLRVSGQMNHSNPEECYLSESGFRVEFDDDGGVKEVYIPYHSYDSYEIVYNDIQPSRYEPRAFSTGDLMLWGLHVASGMEFLSKNKILHGDLAARNVLLTHSRMAKICDFGLARPIPDGHYQNQINNEVPFKYLAIESLEEKKYSTKTDVWSFGIFLWECFSLGKTPYGEHFTVQSVLDFLLSGMRLDKPIHSTDDFYQLMLLCWQKDAKDRPTFTELVQKIHVAIEERTNAVDDGNVHE